MSIWYEQKGLSVVVLNVHPFQQQIQLKFKILDKKHYHYQESFCKYFNVEMAHREDLYRNSHWEDNHILRLHYFSNERRFLDTSLACWSLQIPVYFWIKNAKVSLIWFYREVFSGMCNQQRLHAVQSLSAVCMTHLTGPRLSEQKRFFLYPSHGWSDCWELFVFFDIG